MQLGGRSPAFVFHADSTSMKIRIVPSSDADEQSLITYVINDSIAIDAGCLTALPIAEQRQIHSVFLSHAHMDHVASLPSFLDNVHRDDAAPVALYASVHTRDALQKHIFNDVIWPDFQRWAEPEHALVSFHDLNDQQTVSVGEEITITPLPLKHVIPTCGFLIETATIDRKGSDRFERSGSVVRCFIRISPKLSPSKGTPPVRSSWRMIPRE